MTFAPEHLYVHWPFCKNKCHYCDFVAFEKHDTFMHSYHESLCNDVRTFVAQHGKQSQRVRTIFFGGGTPSLYPLHLFRSFFETLHQHFSLSALEEVTLEVNPGGITREHCATWKELGINRLSVGVQVLDDQVLASLNRHQTNDDVFELMEMVPDFFENVSADLILGLPGVTDEVWYSTLEHVVTFPITHVSVYFLMVHEKTPLYFNLKKGMFSLMRDDAMVDRYEETIDFLMRHDFMQYEVSNFARSGFASHHNTAYWQRRPYVGFGLGAASFDGFSRYRNVKNLTLYLENYEKKSPQNMFSFQEKLTKSQEKIELLMLGLRQSAGLGLHHVLYLTDHGSSEDLLERINQLQEESLVSVKEERLYLTPRGMALSNEVITHLF